MELVLFFGDAGDSDLAYIVYKKVMITTFTIAAVIIPFGLWTLKIGMKANVNLVKQITILLLVSVASYAANTLTFYYLLRECNNTGQDV